MTAKTADKILRVEAAGEYVVIEQEGIVDVARQRIVNHVEIVNDVEHVEAGYCSVVTDVLAGKTYELVENGQCVAHAAVSLLCHYFQCALVGGNALALSNVLQVRDYVSQCDAREVVDLAAAQYGGQNLVLLGCGEDKNGVRGRFLKGFEESVESCGRKHVHLIDDEHAVAPYLRRYANLRDKVADVVDRVVGRSVEFVYVH